MAAAVSARDPRVQRAAALLREPRDDLVALDGPELIAQGLEYGLGVVEALARDAEAWAHIGAAPAAPDALRALGALGQPAEVVAIVRAPEPPRDVPPGALVLAGVADAGNVGGIARTAAALSGPRVVIAEGTAHPFGRKALRASMGAALKPGLVKRLRLDEIESPLAAAVPRGGAEPAAARGHAIVLGSERTGLTAEQRARCALAVTVPAPGFESLNVAAAAAILLWELRSCP